MLINSHSFPKHLDRSLKSLRETECSGFWLFPEHPLFWSHASMPSHLVALHEDPHRNGSVNLKRMLQDLLSNGTVFLSPTVILYLLKSLQPQDYNTCFFLVGQPPSRTQCSERCQKVPSVPQISNISHCFCLHSNAVSKVFEISKILSEEK